jgi:formate dehydrogenase iron-sulfur subunit
LLAEAQNRIQAAPDLYVDHIWGEHEVGGTSVLYISDVDLVTAGWPASLGHEPVPEWADKVLHTVPATFLTVGAAMAGIHWVIKRRQKLAAAATSAAVSAPDPAGENASSSAAPTSQPTDSEEKS